MCVCKLINICVASRLNLEFCVWNDDDDNEESCERNKKINKQKINFARAIKITSSSMTVTRGMMLSNFSCSTFTLENYIVAQSNSLCELCVVLETFIINTENMRTIVTEYREWRLR